MTSLASVFVEVRPDTSGFSTELKSSLAKTREAVDVAAKLDTSKLKPQLDALKADLRSIQVTKATIDADATKASAKIRGLQAELRGLKEQVKLNADDTEAKAKITALKAEIAGLQGGKAKLSIDSSMASAHLKALQAQLSVFDGKDYKANVSVEQKGVNFAFRGVSNLTTAIVGLAPLAVPALATVAAGIGAVGSAAVAAGGSVGIWGGVMAGALAAYKEDVTNLKALNKSLQTATDPAKIAALKQQIAVIKAGWSQDEKDFDKLKDKFTGAFQAIVKASGPATFGVLNNGMHVLIGLMPRVVPIINAVGGAVSGLIDDLGKFSRTQEFQGILDFFRVEGPAAITLFAQSAGNLLLGVFRLLKGFAPFQTSVLVGFEKMTRSFATWAGNFGQSNAFHQFMNYAAQILPEVRDLFISLATFAGRFVTALAPIGNIELRVVTAFLDRLNQLPIGVLTAFAGAITAVVLGLKAWELAVKAMAISEKLTGVTGGVGKAMDDLKIRTLLARDAFQVTRSESGRLKSSFAGLKAGIADSSGALKTAFRGAAGLGGLALLTTDTKKASTAVNTLKDAAGGAAIGFSLGGPWGAAIGGAVGLLGGLFGASQKAKQAQKDLAAQATSTANSVAATLNKQTGAITQNTVETAKNALANGGVYDAAKTLGVGLNDLTSAYLGNADGAERVGKRILEVRDAQGGEVNMSAKSKKAWDKINAAVFATGGSFASTRRHIQQVNGVNATFANNAGASVSASGQLKTAQDKLKAATQDLNTQIQNEINKFTILRGDHLSQSAAADAVRTSVQNLTNSLKSNSGVIQGNTAKALTNRQAIRDAASALNDKVTADFKANNSTKGYTKAMSIARAETEKGRQKLIDNITAVTGNRTAAKKYVDYLIKNPAHLKTDTPGMDAAKRNIDDLQGKILKLRGLKVSPEIAVSFRAAALVANSQGARNRGELGALHRATGGPVFGSGTATSDSIPAMLSNNEHVWTAREVAAAGGHGAVEAIRSAVLNGKGLALATGGPAIRMTGSSAGKSKVEGAIVSAIRVAGRAAQAAERAAAAMFTIAGGSARTTMDGHAVSSIAAAQIRLMEKLSGVNFRVMQGGYGGNHIAASGSSHNYPGVVDLSPASIAYEKLARRVGFAAWARNIGGRSHVGSGAHIHAVSLLDPSDRRSPQVYGSWAHHGNGLSGYGNDPAPHYAWLPNLRNLLGFGSISAAGGGSAGVRRAVEQAASRFGWGRGSEWNALTRIIQSESGWNPRAENPRSTASGLFQFIDSTARAYGLPGHASRFPVGTQAAAGMRYIRGRYGDPLNAWAYHRAHGTYANGGPVIGRGSSTSDSILARLSNGEHVWSAREVAGAGGHAAVQALRGYAKGGAVTNAPASVTRQVAAQITAMRNALDTSKFYRSLVPYIRRRLSGEQEKTYLARARTAYLSDLKRNSMDRIRSNTSALRKSDHPDRAYAALTDYIRKHLSGREERDRLRMAKEALTADKKRLASEAATANSRRIRGLGGTTIRNIAEGRQGSMARVIKDLTTLIRQDFKGQRERQFLTGVRRLTGLQAQRANVNDRLAAVKTGRANVVSNRNAVREAFTGFGPNIADYASSPTGILGGLRAQLSSVRKFTANIRQLRKLGYPNSIVSQIVGLGLTDGIAAAAQLIGLSKADRRSVISTFGALDRTATGNGVAVSNEMYRGAIKAADAQIKRLQVRQKHIDAVFEHAAEALARRIAKRLHIPVSAPKRPKATHDSGGWLGTGVQLTANYTGKPEAVYTSRQQSQMDEDRALMRKLIARYESGHASGRMAPFIQNAVIRETVDIRRLEQQQAFHERRTTI